MIAAEVIGIEIIEIGTAEVAPHALKIGLQVGMHGLERDGAPDPLACGAEDRQPEIGLFTCGLVPLIAHLGEQPGRAAAGGRGTDPGLAALEARIRDGGRRNALAAVELDEAGEGDCRPGREAVAK